VTTIEDVRPAGNFVKPLAEIASERGWNQIGALDLDQFPYDLYTLLQTNKPGLVNVESSTVFLPADDETEIAIRRDTLALAVEILEEEFTTAVGLVDYQFVGNLERRFRRAGTEDLIVLLTNGTLPPAPATGVVLEENFSVSIALEYRGHWVRLSRAHGVEPAAMRAAGDGTLEKLDGAYPYESGTGRIMARHFELERDGKRLFWGDTSLL
jgi:hypothetical protein